MKKTDFFKFISRGFLLISAVKSLKKVYNQQKSLKTAEKSSLASFQVLQAPESWSKYSTHVFSLQVVNEILSDIEDGADFRDEGPFPVSSEQEEEEHFAPSNR